MEICRIVETLKSFTKNNTSVPENSVKSDSIMRELKCAVALGDQTIPVYVGDVSLPNYCREFSQPQGVRISDNPIRDDINRVVDKLISSVSFYDNDLTLGTIFYLTTNIILPEITAINADLRLFNSFTQSEYIAIIGV